MVMTSEGDKIKHIVSPPRDRKYAIVAYTQFIKAYSSTLDLKVMQNLVNSLIDLCFSTSMNGFQQASTLTTNTEDLLMDGAID